MELNARTQIPFPRDEVYITYRDHMAEVTPFLPAIESFEVRERTESEGALRFVNLWRAKLDIPPASQKLIDPSMFAWTDTATWAAGAFQCSWRIETFAMPGLLDCAGTTRFVALGPAETEVRIEGSLDLHLNKAKVPRLLIGTVKPLIERIVIMGLAPNLLSMGEGVGRFLAARQS